MKTMSSPENRSPGLIPGPIRKELDRKIQQSMVSRSIPPQKLTPLDMLR